MDKYISGSITGGEKISLFALIEESDLYRKQYHEMVKLYALLHIPAFESRKKAGYVHLKERLHLTTLGISRRRWFVYARNIAAVLLLMVTVSVGSIFTYNELDKSGDQLYNETTVPLGSQTKVLLPDGSTVVLNSGSVLKYPLSYGKKNEMYIWWEKDILRWQKIKKKHFRYMLGI